MDNTINDAAIMAALGRQMTRAVARQTVAASNLANIDTPNYKAKEITFAQALSDQLDPGTVRVTDSRHLGQAPAGKGGTVTDAGGIAPRRDGNTVQLDRELLAITRAGGDFTQAQTVLSAKFRLVRYAINEGR